jgi:flagellar basal body P-ring protein FlgI
MIDMVDFERAHDNLLAASDLVVGVEGSGDTLRNPGFTTARRVARASNAYLGASAPDLIRILQAIEAAGALQAEIEVMG